MTQIKLEITSDEFPIRKGVPQGNVQKEIERRIANTRKRFWLSSKIMKNIEMPMLEKRKVFGGCFKFCYHITGTIVIKNELHYELEHSRAGYAGPRSTQSRHYGVFSIITGKVYPFTHPSIIQRWTFDIIFVLPTCSFLDSLLDDCTDVPEQWLPIDSAIVAISLPELNSSRNRIVLIKQKRELLIITNDIVGDTEGNACCNSYDNAEARAAAGPPPL
ncbi:hypothetical protein EVAR_12053_1 [Eumeta japonica]|uniref:Uncharacterized protein n=1 Tax=Eumeta variegata TaxID=151549 RepID=A0A4C1U527_EUMVA|nr:hypothetical protein EVAR_12053_1 [Eumeta japonica]